MLYSKRTISISLKVICCLVLCALLGQHTQAQETALFYEDYEWAESPASYEIPDSLKEEDAVVLLKRRYLEISSDERYLVENSITHNRMYLNSDKAIEENNRVYIPLGEDGVLVENNVRVINPGGKIETLPSSKILSGKDEESGREYKYYALEGLEIGSIVEYMYRQRKGPSLYGRITYVETNYPIVEFDFELISNRNLVFDFKSYNGLAEVTQDTIAGFRSKWSVNAKNVEKFASEPMAHADANKKYYIYKLDRNNFAGVTDANSFGFASSSYFDRVNVTPAKSVNNSLKKLAAQIKVDKNADDKMKLHAIEQFIKTNFIYLERSDPSFEDLASIIRNKGFNEIGGLRLFTQLSKMFDLSPRIAITCNRADFSFDPEFETYLFLDNSLLYYPEIDVVIDPTDNYSRLNHINPYYLGNKALIIKEVKVGEMVTGVGKIGMLPNAALDENVVRMDANINIEGEFDEVEMALKTAATGLSVKGYQPIFELVESDKMEEFERYVMGQYEDKFIPESLSFENNTSADFGVNPLVSNFKLISDEYIEKGGKNYLFKIGMIIGPQSQMYYDEKSERRFDVVSNLAHEYYYTIKFNIPEGYKVANLDELKITQDASTDEHKVFFLCDYTIEDDVVTVKVHESYDKAIYPASFFKPFRAVINTAADFNKITLIFEPK